MVQSTEYSEQVTESRSSASARIADRPLDRAAAAVPAGSEGRLSGRASTRARPRLGRAVAFGAGALSAASVAWMVAFGLAEITAGLLGLAALCGYLIGVAVSWAAWGEGEHPLDRRIAALGAGFAAATWLVGSVLAYAVRLTIVPDSTTSLPERIAAALNAQLSPLDALLVAVLGVTGWRGAR